MLCWGNSTYRELGVDQPEDIDIIAQPTQSKWSQSKNIEKVAAGDHHVLFLTKNGELYSCGNNENGQLGIEAKPNISTPENIEAFKATKIKAIACGSEHSIAVDEWGQPYSWGSDIMGQLGGNNNVNVQAKPRIIKTLASKNIIQVACGEYHSFALGNNGELYSWGANSFGQLGLGSISNKEPLPQLIESLTGIPIAMIACGHNHTFALSKSGAVFGWGKNRNGQLGLQDTENRCYPTHVKMLRTGRVCYIAAGEDFTAFLTLDGGVFTCGSSEYGQTGHGSTKIELAPRKIMELMGSEVSQIAAGRKHLLALVGDRIFASGSYGPPRPSLLPTHIVLNNSTEPPTKKLRLQSRSKSAPKIKGGSRQALGSPKRTLSPTTSKWQSDDGLYKRPLRVCAGGDHSFAFLTSDPTLHIDFRIPDHNQEMLTLTMADVERCESFKDNVSVSLELIAFLETVFTSLSCLNGSFLLANRAHYGCNTKISGVDMKLAEEIFNRLSRVENSSIKELIFNSITGTLLKKLTPSPPDAEVLRIFLLLPLYHEMRNPRRYIELQAPFAQAFNTLQMLPYKIVRSWWEAQTYEYFERLVDINKSVIIYELMQTSVMVSKKLIFTPALHEIFNMLAALNKANYTNAKRPKVPPEVFYIDDLCTFIDINMDYVQWLTDSNDSHQYFCNYPFLFDVQCKSSLLKLDQHLQMQVAISRVTPQILTRLVFDPTYEYHRDQYLNLTVSRSTIVRDTMTQISMHNSSQLKKPLKVQFVGEEAEDAGGVKKEFFLLLLKEIFDPVYGMFKESDETRMIWFSDNPFEDDIMYYLIGAIFGLAIYNSIIIYVPFPPVLYKKILGETINLEDFSDLYPTVTNSLKALLDYTEDDIDEVFCLCFAVNTEIFGEVVVNPLKENGTEIPVTQENKEEYVELYLDYILNKACLKQFSAFNQGFQKVCGGRVIKLFRSYELMSVVIGNEEYDWELFQQNAEYRNGYSSNDKQIQWFWEVFHEMSLEDKKKFLLFLTGSDRVPVTGMKDITIVFQPVADNRYYPVAHTCFNILDLPTYSTKERLRYHLLQAIQQTQGFSLV